MGVYIDSIMEISPEIVEKALAAYGELKREVTEQIKSLAKHPQIVPITAGAAISAILLWRMTTSDNKSVESSKNEKNHARPIRGGNRAVSVARGGLYIGG